MEYTVTSIGTVHSPVKEGTDQHWGKVIAEIHLLPKYGAGVQGLTEFSHLLVLFFMHQSSFDLSKDLIRRPRGRKDMPLLGIFSQRAKHRPNPIGVTAVKLLGIQDNVLMVQGLDAIDGTPVIDLKPYVPLFDSASDAVIPAWIDTLMRDYFS